jgi:hypothetical protein
MCVTSEADEKGCSQNSGGSNVSGTSLNFFFSLATITLTITSFMPPYYPRLTEGISNTSHRKDKRTL